MASPSTNEKEVGVNKPNQVPVLTLPSLSGVTLSKCHHVLGSGLLIYKLGWVGNC